MRYFSWINMSVSERRNNLLRWLSVSAGAVLLFIGLMFIAVPASLWAYVAGIILLILGVADKNAGKPAKTDAAENSVKSA